MARKAIVYRMRDPRDNAIRYIGVTVNPLPIRLASHMSAARLRYTGPSECMLWLSELEALNIKPLIEAIDTVDEDDADEREQYLIAVHRAEGHRLTNHHRKGRYAYKHTHRSTEA